MGRFARSLPLVLLATLSVAAPAAATDPLTRGSEAAQRDVAATCRTRGGPCQPEASEATVAAFERSKTHDALLFQQHLADDVGMTNAPWVGTHNSYNSIAQLGTTVSDTDSNQQLRLVDQLRLGVRSLELDLHQWLGRPTVCHGEGPDRAHAGCSVEGEAGPVVAEIAAWLRRPENRREVVLLYFEDQLGDAAGHDAGAKAVRDALGSLLYAPKGGGCTKLPGTLTRDDVLAAGAQVVAVSGCGPGTGWNGTVFDWSSHVEERPVGFDAKTCGPNFTRATYDTKIVRYYEDSTWLTVAASYAGQASQDDGLTPATTAAMVRCGVDLLGFDQLLPGDGRLAAAVWSWAPGEPAAAGDCAAQDGGRWSARGCAARLVAACRTPAGEWVVTRKPVRGRDTAGACSRAGGVPAAPRTGRENALLATAAGGRTVWLGLRRTGGRFAPLDAR